jgi:hypothetical protein
MWCNTCAELKQKYRKFVLAWTGWKFWNIYENDSWAYVPCSREVWTEGGFTHALFQGWGVGSELLEQMQITFSFQNIYVKGLLSVWCVFCGGVNWGWFHSWLFSGVGCGEWTVGGGAAQLSKFHGKELLSVWCVFWGGVEWGWFHFPFFQGWVWGVKYCCSRCSSNLAFETICNTSLWPSTRQPIFRNFFLKSPWLHWLWWLCEEGFRLNSYKG